MPNARFDSLTASLDYANHNPFCIIRCLKVLLSGRKGLSAMDQQVTGFSSFFPVTPKCNSSVQTFRHFVIN